MRPCLRDAPAVQADLLFDYYSDGLCNIDFIILISLIQTLRAPILFFKAMVRFFRAQILFFNAVFEFFKALLEYLGEGIQRKRFSGSS